MAINYFIGWEVEDLERELRAAQEDLAAGKASIQAGAGDVSVQNRVEISIPQRIEMLYKALSLKAPEDYPVDQITRITQAKIAFS